MINFIARLFFILMPALFFGGIVSIASVDVGFIVFVFFLYIGISATESRSERGEFK